MSSGGTGSGTFFGSLTMMVDEASGDAWLPENTQFAGIKRKNQKRMITLYSNILTGFSPNQVVAQVQAAAEEYSLPEGVSIDMTGEQEEQAATMSFLGSALLVSLGLIFLILVAQFNSVGKPMIILTEILFSLIGVFLGFALFKMDVSADDRSRRMPDPRFFVRRQEPSPPAQS